MSEDQLLSGRLPRLCAPLVVKPTRGFGKQFSAACRTESDCQLEMGYCMPSGLSAERQAALEAYVREAGTVSGSFTQARLDALLQRHGIGFCTLNLAPGQPLRRFEGNVSVLGHVIVPGADAAASARQGQRFLHELDELLGVEVAKYELDPEAGH
jgi:hypothetical protein